MAGGGGEAAENVQVVVRVRPLSHGEKSRGERRCVECVSDRSEVVVPNVLKGTIVGGPPRRFTFDHVYDTNTTQESLFETSVAPVVDEVLRGYSCTVFAYGQTGTGKTYTMEGVKDEDGMLKTDGPDIGIIVRAVRRVFAALERLPADSHVKISFLEIYNERLDDLLAVEPSAFMADAATRPIAKSGKERNLFGDGVSTPSVVGGVGMANGAGVLGSERLKIVEDKRAGIKVQNLEEIPVKNADEVFSYVSRGIAKRATAETACNAQSSRSHCVFTLTIHVREVMAEGEDTIKVGKLNLVDLAGSECVGRSGAKDVRAREAGNINQSLLTLGRVITALVDHLPHIPYRDSKLTRLLQDSLGGRTKTCIIATLSPSASCFEESMSTLEYANRAKNIKNRPEANARMEKRALITAYAGEIEALKNRLAAQIAKEGVFLPVEEYEALQGKIRQLEYEVEDLTSLKAATEEECAGLKAALGEMRDSLDALTAKHETTTAELEATTADLVGTRQELGSERVAHEETAAVAAARASTESLLTGQASAMADTLHHAVADVAGLHAKVARTTTVLASNEDATSQYVRSVLTRLDGLGAASDAFHTTTMGHLAAAVAAVAAMANASAVNTAAMVAAAGKLRGVTAGLGKTTTAAAVGLEADIAREMAGVKEAVTTAAEAAAVARAADTDAITALLDTLAGQMAAHQTSMMAWAATSQAALDEVAAAVSAHASAHADQLAAVKSQVASQGAALQAALQAHERDTAAMVEGHAASLAAATTAAIATITTTLQGLASAQAGALTSQAAALRASMVETAAQVTAGTSNTITSLADLVHSTTAFGKSAANQVAAARSGVARHADSAMAAVACSSDAIVAGQATVAAGMAAATTAANAATATILAKCAAPGDTITAFLSRAKSTAVAASEQAGKEHEALVAAVESGNGDIAASATRVETTLSSAHAAVEAHAADVSGWVADSTAAAAGYVTTSLRTVLPTGTTPAKREYPAPSSWVATSPADRLVTKYRAAKAAVGAEDAVTPADVDAWYPRSLPPAEPVRPSARAPGNAFASYRGPTSAALPLSRDLKATMSAVLAGGARPPSTTPAAVPAAVAPAPATAARVSTPTPAAVSVAVETPSPDMGTPLPSPLSPPGAMEVVVVGAGGGDGAASDASSCRVGGGTPDVATADSPVQVAVVEVSISDENAGEEATAAVPPPVAVAAPAPTKAAGGGGGTGRQRRLIAPAVVTPVPGGGASTSPTGSDSKVPSERAPSNSRAGPAAVAGKVGGSSGGSRTGSLKAAGEGTVVTRPSRR